ncbi:hypothetical protein RHMOL_Rhmol03G0031300 [Rhododendron molle]|uniref:Uncharacterized protein n=1 Tax=Rhododendron molle TaxID=49168 RepID=A0ACC0PB44_RHOML|nr:hypothetical protein RHMOL_Rhmol03G0031300 [Rhododendron molle]
MNLASVEENDWIQLLHGSHGQSGRKIKWIPKLHHMYVNGQTSSFQPPLMQFFSCIHSHIPSSFIFFNDLPYAVPFGQTTPAALIIDMVSLATLLFILLHHRYTLIRYRP